MRKAFIALSALALGVLAPATAAAHVTVQPSEAVAGGFQTFVFQVPNERDDAGTIEVKVTFPKVFAFVSFQDVPGWDRNVKMVKFDEPVEAFGQEVTEGVGSVTWTGNRIGPGEFERFSFSAGPIPEGELVFKADQSYDSGEVVRWSQPADGDNPAPRAMGIDIGAEEGTGQLALLATINDRVAELEQGLEASDTHMAEMMADISAEPTGSESDDNGVLLGSIGIGLGGLALIVALLLGRKAGGSGPAA